MDGRATFTTVPSRMIISRPAQRTISAGRRVSRELAVVVVAMTRTVAGRLFRNDLLRNLRGTPHALIAGRRRSQAAVHQPRERVHEHLALLAGELAEDLV